MEKFFKLKENGTSVKIEFIAGITTFVLWLGLLIPAIRKPANFPLECASVLVLPLHFSAIRSS